MLRSGKTRGILALVVAAAIGFFAYSQNRVQTADEAHNALTQAAQTPAQAALFNQLSDDFGDEYQQFLTELAASDADLTQQESFEAGGAFTQNLRRDNAQYITSAPMEDLRAINQASLTLLESLQDDPALCGRFAILGGAGLTLEEAESLDMDILAASTAAGFQAMAAGRDTPVAHPAASDGDIAQTLSMWQVLPDVTPDMMRAISSADPDHPAQCAANLSFQRFIINSDDPVVQRAMIRLVQLSMGI